MIYLLKIKTLFPSFFCRPYQILHKMATKENGNGTLGSLDSGFPAIIDLNVGGVFYSTSLVTLISEPKSKLGQLFGASGEGDEAGILKDSKVKVMTIFLFGCLESDPSLRTFVESIQILHYIQIFGNLL